MYIYIYIYAYIHIDCPRDPDPEIRNTKIAAVDIRCLSCVAYCLKEMVSGSGSFS